MGRIIRPAIFRQFPEIAAGMSVRGKGSDPFRNNFSKAVGDNPDGVDTTRRRFAESLGFAPERLAMQSQVHGDRNVRVAEGYRPQESDGLYTNSEGWLLGVTIADCTPILMYDPTTGAIAAVHSGWRGTARSIAHRSVERLSEELDVDPSNLIAWIGPSAGGCCYEVGEDVYGQFDERYSLPFAEGKRLFDNRHVILDQLVGAGLDPGQIEIDIRCTICNEEFHSYRRDGKSSGRMLAAIGRSTVRSESIG